MMKTAASPPESEEEMDQPGDVGDGGSFRITNGMLVTILGALVGFLLAGRIGMVLGMLVASICWGCFLLAHHFWGHNNSRKKRSYYPSQ